MIYFAPTYSTMQTVAKCFGRSLLVLPICVALIGCDSASSNDDKRMTTKIVSSDNQAEGDLKDISQNLQNSSPPQTDNELDTVTEGQSLIAAARSGHHGSTNQSLMGTETSNRNNTLQATLMGDYGGMVPCDFCSGMDVTLNLFADGSVSKTSIYNNPESPHVPLTEAGVYRQDNNTITIAYEDKKIESYDIQDNHLILTNADKTLNNDYVLSRQ